MKNWIKRIAKWIGKTILFLLGFFLVLFGLVWAVLKFPTVQNYLVHKATHFVSEKTGTRVELGRIGIAFPKSIVLEHLFLDDAKKDTLLYLGELEVDIDMLALLNKKVEVNYLGINHLNGRLTRDKVSGQFNFQFLIDAFVSKEPKAPQPKDTTSSSWLIGAEKLELSDARFSFLDSLGATYLVSRLSKLELELDDLDLAGKGVRIDESLISGLQVSLLKGKSPIPDTSKSKGSGGWDYVLINQLQVDHFLVDYRSLVDSTHIFTNLGTAQLESAHLSLANESVDLKNFDLQHTVAKIGLRKDPVTQAPAIVDTVKKAIKKGWMVNAGRIYFHENSFDFDYSHVPPTTEGIDFNHLHLTGLNTEIANASYQGLNIKAQIKQLQAQEKNSGFGIRSLRANLKMDSGSVDVKKLNLVTNHSRIGHSLHASYTSLDQIASTLQANCRLEKTNLAVQELFLFAPQLKKNPFLAKNAYRDIQVSLHANGSMKKMNIYQLNVNTADSTQIVAKGIVTHADNPDKLSLDLDIQKVYTTSNDLNAILPDSTLPSSIAIPRFIQLQGHHSGTMSSFSTQLAIKSSHGNAHIKAKMRGMTQKRPAYDLHLETPGFDFGHLIKQSTVGRMSGTVALEGEGLDQNTAKAAASVYIRSIRLQDYVYKEIKLDAHINQGQANVYTSVNDSNVALRLNGEVGFLKGKEYCKAHLNLLGLDLYELHFQEEHLQVSAMVDVDLKGFSMSSSSGHLDARNIQITKDAQKYRIDSLVLVSVNESNRNSMELSSSIIAAKFNGNIDLLSVAPTVTQHLNQYFEFGEKSPKSVKPQNFEFEVKINESAIVREILLPSLNTYDPIQLKGGFNSAEDKLWLNLDAPNVEYGSMKLTKTKFDIDSDKDKINYDFGLESFHNGGIELDQTSFSGHVRSDTVNMNLQIKDSTIGNKLVLNSFLTKKKNNHFHFSMLPGISIGDRTWEVDKDNFIEFGTHYLYVNRFGLQRHHQSILAQTSPGKEGNGLNIKIEQFHLHTLSRLVERKDSLLKGTINGEAKLMNYQKQLAFTSDLSFTDLTFKTSKIGNLYIKADNLTDNRYTVKAHVDGMNNDVDLGGYLSTVGDKSYLDMKVDIKALQMASIESFTSGQIKGSSGAIKGTIDIQGEPSAPDIDGRVIFNEVRTKVAFLNEYLYMKSEAIEVSNKGVHFPEFTVRDTLNNTAVVDGWVYMKKFKDYKFDLRLKTSDFLVLNTTAIQNKMYYGRVTVDSDIKLKGTPALPEVKADIALVGGSYFTYTIPESKMVVDRGDGVIEFLYDPEDMHPIMMRHTTEMPKESALKGMDLMAKIKIDSYTGFKLMLDPTSGDSLVVRGDANLNLAIDPSGKMSLSGIYELTSGKYKAYIENVVPKEFLLEKGSKIIWNGDPLDAHVDITARYDIKTSARDLMTIGNSGMPITDSSALAKPLMFNVFLLMKGELLKPVISFKLGMPENQRSAAGGAIYSKINEINAQEAELNKQVFSLLVLSKFMPATPTGGGGGAASVARSSVSKIMSDQLNSLSSKYLKGVEMTVDLQSYNYSQGGKTQSNTALNVGVKKSFNRITVQVGSNVALHGQQAAKQNNVQNLTSDVQIGYMLTEDGRYQLEAFRQNQVDGLVNGIIVETGVGIMFNRNFTTYKELFSPPKKEGKK